MPLHRMFCSNGIPQAMVGKLLCEITLALNLKDLIVPLALFNHTLDKYREASYTVEDVIEQMKKAVDEFFEAKIMNIVISVDYDNNSQPDKNIVGQNDPEQSNWTQAQKN